MLFKIIITKTIASSNWFGTRKTKNVNTEYLVSAENEQHVKEYTNRFPKEGVDTYLRGLWQSESKESWKEEQLWERVEGDDNDAHILLLKSPTGVVYEKQLRYL